MKIGCRYRRSGASEFSLWAPLREKVELLFPGDPGRAVAMKPDGRGYWHGRVEGLTAGARYLFRLDGEVERPDPASHFQPEGVHGASCVVDQGAFAWSDESRQGRALGDLVAYEVHIGTFTPEGTFAAAVSTAPGAMGCGSILFRTPFTGSGPSTSTP